MKPAPGRGAHTRAQRRPGACRKNTEASTTTKDLNHVPDQLYDGEPAMRTVTLFIGPVALLLVLLTLAGIARAIYLTTPAPRPWSRRDPRAGTGQDRRDSSDDTTAGTTTMQLPAAPGTGSNGNGNGG